MRLQFILSEIGIGLRRNLAMTVSVILVTLVSLTFVGGALLLQKQIATMKDYWYDRVQVSIFLCSEDSDAPTCAAGPVNDEVREQIQADLDSSALESYVDQVFYESREGAFDRFKEQFADNPAIYENVTAEQMPESYRVKLQDPEKYEVVSQFFSGREGVEEVVDQRQLLEKFFQGLNLFTQFSLGLAGIMLVAAGLLVATTIRLAAFNRRRETGIMRLVGASNTLLQLPFLLEGIIAVSIGAALAVGTLWAVVHYFVEGYMAIQFPVVAYIGTGSVWAVAPWLFLVGIVLAGVSSLITLSRYLKV